MTRYPFANALLFYVIGSAIALGALALVAKMWLASVICFAMAAGCSGLLYWSRKRGV
jgi:hypothetical protein